ncbi:MAG: tRNA (N6-threonylcarbamoyladenosine(37)-N6)-methyltransferase TrmO [bacterium]
MKLNKITYNPIGIIHSPFKNCEGTPIQPAGAKKIQGIVEIKNEFVSGLKDLDGFSHIFLIYHFHLANGFSLEVIPFLDKVSRGLFATRAPKRPNSIGMSVVKLLKIEGTKIFVENIDVVDGTPLLDIKPYVKEFDSASKSKSGWLTNSAHRSKKMKSDARFK